MAGGSVKGGQVLGRYPQPLGPDNDYWIGRGRFIPTTPWDSVWVRPLSFVHILCPFSHTYNEMCIYSRIIVYLILLCTRSVYLRMALPIGWEFKTMMIWIGFCLTARALTSVTYITIRTCSSMAVVHALNAVLSPTLLHQFHQPHFHQLPSSLHYSLPTHQSLLLLKEEWRLATFSR